jgi:hypothetical protein
MSEKTLQKSCFNDLIDSFQLLVGFNKFDNGTFRQIFKIKKLEWCSMMAGTARSNYMTNLIVNMVKSTATEKLFHKCPFSGSMNLSNIALAGDVFFSIYPSGIYQLFLKIFDDIDPQIVFVKLTYDLKN